MTSYSYQTQTVREAPEIEAYKLGLLQLAKRRGEIPVNLPQQQVAGLTGLQQQAQDMAKSGIGGYQNLMDSASDSFSDSGRMLGGVGDLARQSTSMSQMMPQVGQNYAGRANEAVQGGMSSANPYLNTASSAGNFGQNAAQNAMGMSQGLGSIGQRAGNRANYLAMQGAGSYDPNSVSSFMDPYQKEATQGMLAEMNRQANMGINDIRGNAVGQGAFGGSRQAVAESEYLKGVNEQKNRMIADQYSKNFGQAQGASMGAYEGQMQRLQGAGQTSLGAGQLGIGGLQAGSQGMLQAGQLGSAAQQQAAQMGLQNAQAFGQLGAQTATQGGALALQGLGQGQSGLQSSANLMNQNAAGYGALGQQQAALGAMTQGLGQNDAKFASIMGAVDQENQQKQMDTTYKNRTADAYMQWVVKLDMQWVVK